MAIMGCIGCKIVTAIAVATMLAKLSSGSALPPFDQDDVLDVCFVTDNKTLEQIKIWGYDVTSYFQVLTNIGNAAMMDLKPGLRMKLNAALVDTGGVSLENNSAGAPLSQALSRANQVYWGQRGTYQYMHGQYDCDVAMLALNDDPVFAASGMTGITNVYKVCTSDSYGIIQLAEDNLKSGIEFMHQIGHLLGIMHDEPMNSMGTLETTYPNLVDEVRMRCSSPNNDCQATPNDACIMKLNPGGIPVAPMQWSGCSRAYFNLSSAIAQSGTFVNHVCFTGAI